MLIPLNIGCNLSPLDHHISKTKNTSHKSTLTVILNLIELVGLSEEEEETCLLSKVLTHYMLLE